MGGARRLVSVTKSKAEFHPEDKEIRWNSFECEAGDRDVHNPACVHRPEDNLERKDSSKSARRDQPVSTTFDRYQSRNTAWLRRPNFGGRTASPAQHKTVIIARNRSGTCARILRARSTLHPPAPAVGEARDVFVLCWV